MAGQNRRFGLVVLVALGFLALPLIRPEGGFVNKVMGSRVAEQRQVSVGAGRENDPRRPDGSFQSELTDAEEGPELPFELDPALLTVIFFVLAAVCIFGCLNADADLTTGQGR
mmetsp:Transcript_56034/g.121147  ORF Transcript_56034/g.121147 Transcript_56034/m.121147 type:complete len:113 (+) Transcript_56034:61-399(+)